MFGTALRLLGAQRAFRQVRLKTEVGLERMGDRVQNLIMRIALLSVAGIVLLGAGVFGVLAGFWGFKLLIRDGGAASAGVMAGILLLLGCLIALIAYGITQERRTRQNPTERYEIRDVHPVAPMDAVGHQIEQAVDHYGPVQVAAAAAAAGLLAGLMAKRFRQI